MPHEKVLGNDGRCPCSSLADALARVRRHKSPVPLPTVSSLEHRKQLESEAANIVVSLDYAREKLKI
jgi:hypothetical protein